MAARGLAGEMLAQFGILGGDTHGTGVEMALPHHNAALDNQGGGGKPEFIRAQQRSDGDVPAGA